MQQCDRLNLSWTEASRRAGVAPNTISEIVGGVQPGIKRITALAEFFGASPERLLRLAGRLPPEPETPLTDIPRLQQFAERVARLPPERQRRIMEAALLLLEVGESVEDVDQADILPESETADV